MDITSAYLMVIWTVLLQRQLWDREQGIERLEAAHTETVEGCGWKEMSVTGVGLVKEMQKLKGKSWFCWGRSSAGAGSGVSLWLGWVDISAVDDWAVPYGKLPCAFKEILPMKNYFKGADNRKLQLNHGSFLFPFLISELLAAHWVT